MLIYLLFYYKYYYVYKLNINFSPVEFTVDIFKEMNYLNIQIKLMFIFR